MPAYLNSKVLPPPERPERVPRARLLAALEAGSTRRLTLLSAPAGYGKSTLLAQWRSATPKAVAWLSLDEADNDLRRFLGYLGATLRQAGARVGARVGAEPPQASAPEGSVDSLVAELARGEGEVILVLDDYHLISEEAVHEAMRFLLERAPPRLRLMIGSRSEPPLQLARWRVRGELCELRADDLRFASDEATGFLAAMGLSLSPADSAQLVRRTEGWAAGLQLAALTLQGRREVAGFIETFTGTDRFVLDYLTEEVVSRQPGEVQNFLVMTSVLEKLHGPLCDAVTGAAGGQATLRRLERHNLFIAPLDDRREWYRVHGFFRDLLQERLEDARPGLALELHRRASDWFRENGAPTSAFRHALHAGDAARAAAIAEQAGGENLRAALLRLYPELSGSDDTKTLLEAALERGLGAHAARLELDPAPMAQAGTLEPLSERELEVLRLLAAGLGNKAVAKRLGVSLNTVKTHSKNIYAKLGVSNRTQASLKAAELGLAAPGRAHPSPDP